MSCRNPSPARLAGENRSIDSRATLLKVSRKRSVPYLPHLTIQHSPGLALRHDMSALCESLRQVMAAQGCFPLGGIRVRARPTPAAAVADTHPDNACADLVLRMGAGRAPEIRQAAGAALMEASKALFAEEQARPHFALALEIVEIDPAYSWKANSIHPRIEHG